VGKAKRAHHLFAERTLNVAKIASPILGQQPSLYIAVEAAMRPIGYARDVAMLHGVEMNVIDMAFEICLISNGMLPIASLPNAFFPLADFTCRTRLRIEASKPLLMELQRVAKFASPSGNAQRA
jgi:hypothetical protein